VAPLRDLRAHAREIAFVLKLFPMLPSGIVDRVTGTPIVEEMRYASHSGEITASLYRPPGPGRHPAMVMCLGVVPFGVDHPQVPRLCDALARAGFVALIHWSKAMRDKRLTPEDADDIALAYSALLERCDVDAGRSGLFGTCVGGTFALLAAAKRSIRDRVAFVGAFAPYSSLWTFARDIVTGTREEADRVASWAVDPLTREVFDHTVSGLVGAQLAQDLSAIRERDAADAALAMLPGPARERLDAMSPMKQLADIHAPCIVFGHDRDDAVIPAGESRRLAAALRGRRGVRYTEYAMFQHADPTKRHLSPLRFVRELARSGRYPNERKLQDFLVRRGIFI